MKKLLMILISVSLLLAFSGLAMASGPNQTAAIERLGELGIMQGDANGDFRAASTLTRAEFAKIVVVTGGFKSTAQTLQNTAPVFKDVKTGAWYAGYVNAAVQEGLMNGITNNAFKPTQTISNQEVVTVLLRLLGYKNLAGNWPANYLNLAKTTALLSDSALGSAKAVRGNAAVMVNNTLDKTVVQWNSNTNEYEEQKTVAGAELTLLSQLQASGNQAAGSYYGVVLDYSLNGKVVSAMKLFTENGTTATYPVKSGVYADISAKADAVYKNYYRVEKGTLVKYSLDASGNIIADSSGTFAIDSDNKGDTSKTNKTIVMNNVRYTLAANARIFNLTVKNDQLNVELLTLDQALAGNILYGSGFKLTGGTYYRPGLAAILPAATAGTSLDNLVVANYATSTGTSYGFVKDCGFKGSDDKDMVTFYGDPIDYVIAGGSSANIAKGKLYDCYKSGDSALRLVELLRSDFTALDGTSMKQFCEVVEQGSGLLNVQKIGDSSVTAQYEITNKTVIYKYNWSKPDDDPEYAGSVDDGDHIYLLTNKKAEALLIIIDDDL